MLFSLSLSLSLSGLGLKNRTRKALGLRKKDKDTETWVSSGLVVTQLTGWKYNPPPLNTAWQFSTGLRIKPNYCYGTEQIVYEKLWST